MTEIPEHVVQMVKARLKAPSNIGLLIWVEQDPEGHWLVHANTGREADRRMQVVHNTGRFYALASEVLKS